MLSLLARPLPYLSPSSFSLGPLSLTAFDLCVALAVITGVIITVSRAEKLGWDRERALRLVLWTVLSGGIGSHLAAVLLYHPEAARRDPLILLQLWGSMSSFGGIAGGILGGMFAARRMGWARADTLRYFDLVAYAFPFAWIFGRLGCSLAHDHLGVESTSAFAVDFPGGPRFDLGLLELGYTLPLALLFYLLGKKPRANGLYLALFFTLYGPVRFFLDTLRAGDVRYWGWTPGQYGSVLATLLGLALLRFVLTRSDAAA